jgi:putative drug exporter of the RND superfamily
VARLTGWVAGGRGKYVTLALWIVAAVLIFPVAGKLTSVQNNDAVTWLPRSAEATKAFERAQAAFPSSTKLVAVVVYVRDAGLTAADRARVDADRTVFAGPAEGGQTSPVIPSADGKALLVSFPLAGSERQRAAAVKTIKTQLTGTPAGLHAALTGSAGASDDLADAFRGVDTTLLLVAGGVVALLLLIIYRSPVLWLVPLLCVGLASQLAAAVVYLLARYAGLTINGQSQGILTILVFGAGTDYALLLIARYREELRRHADRHAAMNVALRRSYPALLASAATVTIALLCLLAAQLNNHRALGPVAALGISSAFLAMTTLLPALTVVCGRWLFWPLVPRFTPDAGTADTAEDHGVWRRIAGFVARRPRVIWLATALLLGGATAGITNIHIGLSNAEMFTTTVGSVTGQRIVAAHYPSGSSSPVEILADARHSAPVQAAAAVDGISSVHPPVTSPDGRWVDIRAILTNPPDSQAAETTVDRVRAAVHAVPGAQALVTGDTAVRMDTERAMPRDAKVVIPLILIVVLTVLTMLLRSIVAPILLIASVVLSFGAAMGVAGLLFRALSHPRIGAGLPLLAFLFLVALGVDYTIFLMSRAREEAATLGHPAGVQHALTITGAVITSAGLVLAATFTVLAVLPLVIILQLGLVVAVGVLIDTLVVRTLLVPALSLDIGARIWWPGALARHRPAYTAVPSEPSSQPTLSSSP